MDIYLKNTVKIIIFLAIFIPIVYFVFSADINFENNNVFAIKSIKNTEDKINEINAEISNMQKEVELAKETIEEFNSKLSLLNSSYIEKLTKISELNMDCAKLDVRGPGITIRVEDNLSDDPYDLVDKIVHDWDVFAIVNDLNKFGAEAISVNGKRIVSTTEIICVGPVIKINGEAVAAPFIIRAIGNPEDLINVVELEDSYGYNLKATYGINISAIKNYDVSIPMSKKEIDIKFAKISEVE